MDELGPIAEFKSVNQPKKICLILPSLDAGGMERVMSELANYFVTCPDTVVDFVLMSKKNHFYALDNRVRIYEPEFPVHGAAGAVKLLLFIRRTVKRLAPDCVLSFGEMFNSFALLSTLGLRTRVFVSDRSKPDRSWGAAHNFLRWLLYRTAYGIVAQTAIARDIMYKRIGHKNIRVIGNPIRMSPVQASAVREKIVLSVGRMVGTKQHDRLIRMYAKVKQPGWQLYFAGDGPERQNLEQLTSELGLTADVCFLGNQKDIDRLYAMARIFAFTSISEGFPNALGEAMSAGLAPICYNFVAGASDLVENGRNGIIVPLGDDAAFEHGLETLMKDEAQCERLAREAEQSVQKYHISDIGKLYYDFLLSDKRSAQAQV